MADFFTYFIYTGLIGILMFLTHIGINMTYGTRALSLDSKHYNYWVFAVPIIVIYSLVIGLRYDVGRDYLLYLSWFKSFKLSGKFPVEESDIGYVLLNKFLVTLDAHFAWLFTIIAFLQIFFMLKSLKKTPFLAHWYIFFFFTTLYFFNSVNHMRQTVAYFIFFYSIYTFLEKKYVWTIFLMLLAASFHKSVMLFVLVYPILNIDFYKNRLLQFVLLIFSITLAPLLFELLLTYFGSYAELLGYEHYVEQADQFTERTQDFNEGNAGLGKYFFILVDGLIIYYSRIMKHVFQRYHFTSFYNLYLTGALLKNVVASNYILARVADYLGTFRILILSFLVVFIFKYIKNEKLSYGIVVTIAIVFLAYFYKAVIAGAGSPFQFVF